MGGYSRQIRDENDRWAVVNYIRSLQNNLGVGKMADVKNLAEPGKMTVNSSLKVFYTAAMFLV